MAYPQHHGDAARTDEGKGASRRLRRCRPGPGHRLRRRQGRRRTIQLEHNAALARHPERVVLLVDPDPEPRRQGQKVLLRDMQRHPFKRRFMHLDFQRVDENEAIRVNVPLHFLNQEKSPAGKTAGVVITHELNEVDVSCLPKDLPEFIEVDLANLDVGDIVHLSGPQAAERRRDPGTEAGQGTRRRGRHRAKRARSEEEERRSRRSRAARRCRRRSSCRTRRRRRGRPPRTAAARQAAKGRRAT